MSRQKRHCRSTGCLQDPYLGGLCQRHFEEDEHNKKRREEAVAALHSGIVDGNIPTDQALRDDLRRICKCWDRACQVLHAGSGTGLMPVDEAEPATEWCIELAREIVEAQRALAAGKPMPASLAFTGDWVWERFRNLEAGLRSNGTPRAERFGQ